MNDSCLVTIIFSLFCLRFLSLHTHISSESTIFPFFYQFDWSLDKPLLCCCCCCCCCCVLPRSSTKRRCFLNVDALGLDTHFEHNYTNIILTCTTIYITSPYSRSSSRSRKMREISKSFGSKVNVPVT